MSSFGILRLSLVVLMLLLPGGLRGNELLTITNQWKFWQGGSLDGVNWTAPNFDDSAWPVGGGLLYVENAPLPAPKTTPLNIGGTTYYFRTEFVHAGPLESGTALLCAALIDDGAVFYLNGVEIQRVGMSGAGPVLYSTLATRVVGDAGEFDTFVVTGTALAPLVAGTNILAVEVHQQTEGSSDIVFGCALNVVTGLPPALVRGPYIQNSSSTNMTIRWRTLGPTTGVVRFGTNVSHLNHLAAGLTETSEHEVVLTQLQPDTRYYYSVGNPVGVLAGGDSNHFFVTAPMPGTPKPTRIWVFGDSGTGSSEQVAVRNAYQNFAQNRPADFMLLLGDNAYPNGTDAEYQTTFFNIYTNQLRNTVAWSTLGNHDTANATTFSDAYPYFQIFSLPKAGEAGGVPSGTEHYYSFVYGNIHVICLDTMTGGRSTNSPMYHWLTNDLANVTADWLIAIFHHPPYTKGSHDSDTEIESIRTREVFLPVLERAGVDLVLSGHSHNYERTFLLNGHYGPSSTLQPEMKLDAGSGRPAETGAYLKPRGRAVANRGTVYAIAGSAGATTPGGALNHPADYVSLSLLGSLVVDISSNRLDAIFLRENGTTNDSFTIQKVNYPPVASNLVIAVHAEVTKQIQLSGSDINGDAFTFALTSNPVHGWLAGFDPVTGQLEYTPTHGYVGADTFTFVTSDGHTSSAPATVTLNVLAPADTNSNNVSDAWESFYQITNIHGDDDGDGLSNGREFFAGTNPKSAASTLRLYDAIWSAAGLELRFDSASGRTYSLLYRESLTAGDWQKLTDVPAMLGPQPRLLLDATVGSASRRYYQLVTPAQP